VELIEMDNNINDTAFADAVYQLFIKQWEQRSAGIPVATATTAG
jgi:hypothetical protein